MKFIGIILMMLCCVNVVVATLVINPVDNTTAVTGEIHGFNFRVKGNATQDVTFYIFGNKSVTFNGYVGRYQDSYTIVNTTKRWDDGGDVTVTFFDPGTYTIFYGFNDSNNDLLNTSSFTVFVTGNSSPVLGDNYSDAPVGGVTSSDDPNYVPPDRNAWRLQYCQEHPGECSAVQNSTLPSTDYVVNSTPAAVISTPLVEQSPAQAVVTSTIVQQPVASNVTVEEKDDGAVQGDITIVLEILGGLILFVVGGAVIIYYKWKKSKDV